MNEGKGGFFMDSNKNAVVKPNLQLFGSTKVMVVSALLIALSIIFGKFLKIPIGDSLRISFENTPILMAGIFFGPVIGAAVGACADIIGCFLYGYSIIPLITVGAASIGLISGLLSHLVFREKLVPKVFFSVFSAHIIGSMIIKSIALYRVYSTPFEVLILRVPLYIGTALVESYLIYLLLNNKSFSAELEKICRK